MSGGWAWPIAPSVVSEFLLDAVHAVLRQHLHERAGSIISGGNTPFCVILPCAKSIAAMARGVPTDYAVALLCRTSRRSSCGRARSRCRTRSSCRPSLPVTMAPIAHCALRQVAERGRVWQHRVDDIPRERPSRPCTLILFGCREPELADHLDRVDVLVSERDLEVAVVAALAEHLPDVTSGRVSAPRGRRCRSVSCPRRQGSRSPPCSRTSRTSCSARRRSMSPASGPPR